MPTKSLQASWTRSARRASKKTALRVRKSHRALLRTPFVRLTTHFLETILKSGQEEGAPDLEFPAAAILAVLAVPGALLSLMLFDKYSSLLDFVRRRPGFDVYLASVPDKYFFITVSMVITGIVTVLKWDKILPGRQDHANLASLPLSSPQIFLANLTAILLGVSIFALDVNAASSILFPGIVTGNLNSAAASALFVFTHAFVVTLASAFTFFTCFALMGMMMAALPYRLFRSLSLYVRLGLTTALVAILSTSFAVPPLLRQIPANPVLSWLPPVWFLGLYQSLQGKAGPELAALGSFGLRATIAVFITGLITYTFSYRRHFLRIPESADRRQSVRRANLPRLTGLFDRVLLKTPFQRACYHFTLRALFRSEEHCLICGGFFGLGLALASQPAAGAPLDLHAIPLILAFFLITGLRVTFEIPSALRANWVYQITLDVEAHEAASSARKIVLTLLTPAVLLPCLIVSVYAWGLVLGAVHTLYVVALSIALIEALFSTYRKIPFTCSLPPLRNHLVTQLFLYAAGYVFFASAAPAMERWMLQAPWRFLLIPGAWLGIWAVVRDFRRDGVAEDRRLTFLHPAPVEVQRLNLT